MISECQLKWSVWYYLVLTGPLGSHHDPAGHRTVFTSLFLGETFIEEAFQCIGNFSLLNVLNICMFQWCLCRIYWFRAIWWFYLIHCVAIHIHVIVLCWKASCFNSNLLILYWNSSCFKLQVWHIVVVLIVQFLACVLLPTFLAYGCHYPCWFLNLHHSVKFFITQSESSNSLDRNHACL
jgi:hypothetical protein